MTPPESVLTSTRPTMTSPQVRQRQGQKEKKAVTPPPSRDGEPNGILKDIELPEAVKSEWDYKATLAIITILAFITRFWGIGHPNEVVFDEVHFGKVREAAALLRDLQTTKAAMFYGRRKEGADWI